MAFPHDLLEQSNDLTHWERTEPKQASLRRAVSTAYYALYHLLVDAAVSKWAVERQRSLLARTFEHGKMKGVCDTVLKRAKSGAQIPEELVVVARNFIELQEHRHTADYDNSKVWSRSDVDEVVKVAANAFVAWDEIHSSVIAQDFLLQLFLPKLQANKDATA